MIFKLKKIIKFLIITVFLFALQLSANADNYTIKNIVLDNSDRLILIEGKGNFNNNIQTSSYIPLPNNPNNSLNLINNLSTLHIDSSQGYVIDIPNATLDGSSKTYKIQNSKYLKNITLSQFSTKPNIVRVVLVLADKVQPMNFKIFTNGSNIIIKYAPTIIDNSIQHKFYTTNGDMDKTIVPQDLSSTMTINSTGETLDLNPRLKTKYYLSQISQNSDGLILRGLGELTFQKVQYNDTLKEAYLVLDNAQIATKLENKTYIIPSSTQENKALLTIDTLSPKKVKLTLQGENLRDFRFVMAPDSQSMFISHKNYIINTQFSSSGTKVTSYKIEKTATDYLIFSMNFSNSIAYNVFEQHDNFYLDIVNLSDYNQALLEKALEANDVKIKVLKISHDKTRFIIPNKNAGQKDNYDLNFSYANIESNSKSIKLCFKIKPQIAENTIANDKKVEEKKSENINVLYVPKAEEQNNEKLNKPKISKKDVSISSMKKVVIDPGHGGSDGGAIRGIYYEKNLNLTVAKLVQEKLAKKNIYVYMTRDKDTTLTLEDRVAFANEINPDIYVSIHTNSTVGGESFGLETHYYKDDSLDLAKTIHNNFASCENLNKWETKDRGVIKSRFYVINHTEVPSVLIEIGFMSNVDERAKLFTKERQNEIAESITKGILEYLKVK